MTFCDAPWRAGRITPKKEALTVLAGKKRKASLTDGEEEVKTRRCQLALIPPPPKPESHRPMLPPPRPESHCAALMSKGVDPKKALRNVPPPPQPKPRCADTTFKGAEPKKAPCTDICISENKAKTSQTRTKFQSGIAMTVCDVRGVAGADDECAVQLELNGKTETVKNFVAKVMSEVMLHAQPSQLHLAGTFTFPRVTAVQKLKPTVAKSALPEHEGFNDFCPVCRRHASGEDDLYYQKVSMDRQTNKVHKLRIQNKTGYLWTGVPEGRLAYNDAFSSNQLPPLTKATWNDSDDQRLGDNLLFGASTSEKSTQVKDGVRLALDAGKTTFFQWKSKTAKIFACQCEECQCIFHYEWYHSRTTVRDRACAIEWLLAFLFAFPSGCAEVASMTEDTPLPLCARLGYGLLGENGIVPDEAMDEEEEAMFIVDSQEDDSEDQ